MTLLVSWMGIDTHGPGSAYIASDSRISWGTSDKFDFGKKVFSSDIYPEIFGYSGDVLFPSILLTQIIEMIDSGLLFTQELTCDEKNKLVFERLAHAYSKYPAKQSKSSVQIIHISRDTVFENYPNYFCYFFEKKNGLPWNFITKEIPNESGILFILGSGKQDFLKNYDERYQQSKNKNTSRNVFHCFCDTLFNINDFSCGGAPQLVGVYRKPKSVAINFGIIYNKKKYFLGSEIPRTSYDDKILWRNENFEICDGKTLKICDNAMRQPNKLRRK